jgi:hypothetical protein
VRSGPHVVAQLGEFAGAHQAGLAVGHSLQPVARDQHALSRREAQFGLRHHRSDRARRDHDRRQRRIGGDLGRADCLLPDHPEWLQSVLPGNDQVARSQVLDPPEPAGCPDIRARRQADGEGRIERSDAFDAG